MHKTYRSGLLIGFNMKDFNKILHQNSVASVSGLSILFSDIYLKLEAHFVIQAQLVFNQVYFFLISIPIYMLNIVPQWSPPCIFHQYKKKILKFCKDVSMHDIDLEHQK